MFGSVVTIRINVTHRTYRINWILALFQSLAAGLDDKQLSSLNMHRR